MKEFLLKIFILIVTIITSTSTLAYDVCVDGIYYNLKKKTAEVTLYKDAGTSNETIYTDYIVIPETIVSKGVTYPVTSIGNDAFCFCKYLYGITIPNTVTSIGSSAFYGCEGLTYITIPKSVTSIGELVFQGCINLDSITVEEGNSVYDSREKCNAIIKTSTNELVFGGKNTVIPNTVTSIGAYAFFDNQSLTSIDIPNSVTNIGENAFENCWNISSIDIPNSVTNIGNYAFNICKGLTTINLPASVKTIGIGAFSNCPNISSISIDEENPFLDSREDCNAIINSQTNELISGCKNTNIPSTVTSIGDNAFTGCQDLYSITIPNSVTSIGSMAFGGCDNLTSITMPNSITSIGNYAFSGCKNLTSITLPNSLTSIPQCIFNNCKSLTDITIPNSVTSIGNYAFSGCSNLTSITIPNSVTTIGGAAFNSCSNLTTVYISNSIKKIDLGAFASCRLIEDVYCYALKVPSTESNAFQNSLVDEATLHVPAASVDAYKSASPWSTFGTIKAIEEESQDTCATPVISVINGKLHFECATEGAGIHYTIKTNIQSETSGYHTGNEDVSFIYNPSYTITCYATKDGYIQSDTATKTIAFDNSDVNHDGLVDIRDVNTVIGTICGK